MAIFVIKCRFYFAWKLTEASYDICGAGRCTFHGGRNVNITKVELASNAHELLSNWNICAAMWLKLHVYSPVLDATHNPRVAIIVTNVVSALWHGLYPGYFLSFLFCGVLTAVCRSIRQNIDPLIPKSSPVLQCGYKLIMTIWMCVVLHTAAIPFQLCSFPVSWKAWESINFIGHIWLLLALVLSLLLSSSSSKKVQQTQEIEKK
jgi:lysophospholipid acyltransferase